MAGLQVGIVGYGMMGRLHARTWASIRDAEVAAVVDPDEVAQERAAEEHNCQVFDSIELMLHHVIPLHLVVIATHAALHHRQTLLALRARCDVICEKPVALNLVEADEMVNLAHARGRCLAVHHQGSFSDAVIDAVRRIRQGEIGGIRFIEAVGKGGLAPYDLMEVGLHQLHLIHTIAGPAKRAFGHVQERGRDVVLPDDALVIKERYPVGRDCGIGAGDYIFGYFEFTRGVNASIRYERLPERSDEYMTTHIYGTKGQLLLGHSSSWRLWTKPTPQDTWALNKWNDADLGWEPDPEYTVMMGRFARDVDEAIRKRKHRPLVSGKEGRAALEMAHAIYASHRLGQPVHLPLENRFHPCL